jgi:DNA polymerase-3 subunit gamma/tau
MSDSAVDDPLLFAPAPGVASPGAPAYRVLARAYRPQRLSELIGQDVLVRSLTNAIRSGRVAHAFLLTGIRGVGKTTTARIIARALNCIGEDGTGGPTPEPCGVCDPCRAIAEDRHIDVLEMDAATRTGIDDIREIVDSVRYAPTSARFKVYIIDEVHMLSEKAFNGLLKTLEEPPPQAKFVFATTEVRKVPVTILSRCQRFDLRRVDPERLEAHLAGIAGREGVAVGAGALGLIARAADGSVRDALSLLDQAIALASGEADGGVDAGLVRGMLGLADGERIVVLFEAVLAGRVPDALDRLRDLYDLGVDPETALHDLLEICHGLTRQKVAPSPAEGPPIHRSWPVELAEQASLPVLARTWQMLLKGLDELKLAPDPLKAAEMLLVRIAYAAEVPSPAVLVRVLAGGGDASGGPPTPRAGPDTGPGAGPGGAQPPGRGTQEARPAPPCATASPPVAAGVSPCPSTFEEVVELFRARDEPMLFSWLHDQVELVRFTDGEIELHANGHAHPDWPRRIAGCLQAWTGQPWQIELVGLRGRPSLAAQAETEKQARIAAISEDPRLKDVLERFPTARIVDVRPAPARPEPPAQIETEEQT